MHQDTKCKQLVTTVTSSQVERMLAQVSIGADTSSSNEQERLRLKQLSDERASKWPNTLQAARARKERVRQEKAAAEEAARQEADRQEALVRAEQRRMAIERANKVLFDATDDVKALHSKLLLSEVLAENAALAEFKKQVVGRRKVQDAEFAAKQKEALEAAEAAKVAKQQAAKAAALAQKQVQMEQLEHLKQRILEEKAAAQAEGELIRHKAAEEAAELAAKDAAWRAQAKAMNAATKASNDTLLAFRVAQAEQDKQLEAAVQAYCKHKQDVDAQRAADKAAKEAAKEAHRKAMRDMMEENYRQWHNHTEQQLAAHIQAAEDKAAADAEAARRRRQEQQEAQHRSNQQQLARKAAAAAAARQEDAAFKEAWGERLSQLKQQELREVAEAREKAEEVVRFQQWQAQRIAAAKASERVRDAQDAVMTQLAVQEADERVQQYSQLLLEEVKQRQQPVLPLARHIARATKQRQALTPTM